MKHLVLVRRDLPRKTAAFCQQVCYHVLVYFAFDKPSTTYLLIMKMFC